MEDEIFDFDYYDAVKEDEYQAEWQAEIDEATLWEI